MSFSSAPTDLSEIDTDDPCAVSRGLRKILLQLLAGQNEIRVRFRDGDSDEEVAFGPGDIKELRKELIRQEGLCAALTGGRPARRCITAG